ncbi:pyroglutamyl peptidase type [Phlyctema vagabunda]|uniref:Pyroglutamyl peptidase type n=1 Tax=Phlyctema vagabunda TaxID=108571 RepID=A0ABR4PH31_9HELO
MDVLKACLGLRAGSADGDDDDVGMAREPCTEPHRGEPADEKTKKFTVLVTGMGAFPKYPGHAEYGRYLEDDNTSHLITKYLPSRLGPYSEYNPTDLEIRILNPTAAPGCAVKTEYGYARAYIEQLWREHGNSVDLILHLGMADGWEWYSIEKSGWKEGTVKPFDGGPPVEYYLMPDDVGDTVKDLPGPSPWSDRVPEQLRTGPGLDVDALAEHVKRALNRDRSGDQVQVIAHADAGNYLCGFVTYESLARALVGRYRAKSLFCHIPGWKDEGRLKTGRDFVCPNGLNDILFPIRALFNLSGDGNGWSSGGSLLPSLREPATHPPVDPSICPPTPDPMQWDERYLEEIDDRTVTSAEVGKRIGSDTYPTPSPKRRRSKSDTQSTNLSSTPVHENDSEIDLDTLIVWENNRDRSATPGRAAPPRHGTRDFPSNQVGTAMNEVTDHWGLGEERVVVLSDRENLREMIEEEAVDKQTEISSDAEPSTGPKRRFVEESRNSDSSSCSGTQKSDVHMGEDNSSAGITTRGPREELDYATIALYFMLYVVSYLARLCLAEIEASNEGERLDEENTTVEGDASRERMVPTQQESSEGPGLIDALLRYIEGDELEEHGVIDEVDRSV